MTTEEIAHLSALITGHHDAMQAQLRDPNVPMEAFVDDRWILAPTQRIFSSDGTNLLYWRRLAPEPKLVDLDQRDFLGPNRVTCFRPRNNHAVVANWNTADAGGVHVAGYGIREYASLNALWECSRDGGATFGPCSRPKREAK